MTKINANKTTKSTKTEKALSMTPFHRKLRPAILSTTHCDSISGLPAVAGGAPRCASRSRAAGHIEAFAQFMFESVDRDAQLFYST
jgi:hypothetical protein